MDRSPDTHHGSLDIAPAINFECRPGDHLGVAGGQEDSRASKVLGTIQATPRDGANEATPTLSFVGALIDADETRQHRRVGRDWTDRDDPNAIWRQLDGQGFGQGDDRALGRVVDRQPRAWPYPSG